jgi:hypothetical protein
MKTGRKSNRSLNVRDFLIEVICRFCRTRKCWEPSQMNLHMILNKSVCLSLVCQMNSNIFPITHTLAHILIRWKKEGEKTDKKRETTTYKKV